MKLTRAAMAALQLPAGKAEMITFDDAVPGLGLRIRAGGTRTWIFQYRIGRASRRVTIGDAGVLSLAQARKTAATLHVQVRAGRDPSGEKAEGRIRASDTMAAALAAYLPHQEARTKASTFVNVKRHLLKHAKPLHALPLTSIDRRVIAVRMTAITAASGPVESNRVRSSLSAFLGWCVNEGMLDANPADGGNRNPERSRDRVLTDAELKAIWQATASDSDYDAITRLLLLTGQRSSEIGSLRWSEIDGDQVTLPAVRTKNGRVHTFPLSPVARAIIDARPRRGEFVFGRKLNRPFRGWSGAKDQLTARLGAVVGPWTHHDMRRTAATKIAEMGIAPHTIEAVLNHVSGHKRGVAGVYNRADYTEQKRHALNAWADHLLALTEDRAATGTVIPLRA